MNNDFCTKTFRIVYSIVIVFNKNNTSMEFLARKARAKNSMLNYIKFYANGFFHIALD